MIRLKRARSQRPPVGQLIPPEGVPIQLKVAGVGVRVAAQFTDLVITLIAAGSLLVLAASLGLAGASSFFAIVNLLFFVIRVPYYVFTELAWNGQTLGKRLMKIKVVSHDGGSLSVHALVLRNLMKEAEVFLPATLLLTLDQTNPLTSSLALGWITMAFLVPLLNRYRQRLGDYVAGTHVIHLPVPVLLDDLAGQVPQKTRGKKKFVFLAHQLDHYGAFELQTLETVLRAQGRVPKSNQNATIEAIVDKIRLKIDYAERIEPAERLPFLRAFYNAQRQHLEQRQLFGDKRKDKHYSAESTTE